MRLRHSVCCGLLNHYNNSFVHCGINPRRREKSGRENSLEVVTSKQKQSHRLLYAMPLPGEAAPAGVTPSISCTACTCHASRQNIINACSWSGDKNVSSFCMAHIWHTRASAWWSNAPWMLHGAGNPVEMRVSLEGREVNCYPPICGKNNHKSGRKFRQEKGTFMKIHTDLNPYLM